MSRVQKGALDERDHVLFGEVRGYLQGLACGLEMARGLRIESSVTPSLEGYAKLLAARIAFLERKVWPLDG